MGRLSPSSANAWSLVFSDALDGRLTHLERQLPAGPFWVPADSGLPHVSPELIRRFISAARRHIADARAAARIEAAHMAAPIRPSVRAGLRHCVAAVRAYEQAERLATAGAATLRYDRVQALAARGARQVRGKKKGAADPLGHVLDTVIRDDPYMQASAVLAALRDRAKRGDAVVLEVRRGAIGAAPNGTRARPVDLVVVWRHPKTGKQNRTAWSSIEGRRLAQSRARVRARQ